MISIALIGEWNSLSTLIPRLQIAPFSTPLIFSSPSSKSPLANSVTNHFPLELVRKPLGLNILRAYNPDWILSIYCPFLLNQDVLNTAQKGALNLHPGILPEYAGIHTNIWAIQNNLSDFGACIHWMDEGLDTGPVAYQKYFPLNQRETGLGLFRKVRSIGNELMHLLINDLEKGITPKKNIQDLSKRTLYQQKDLKNIQVRAEDPLERIIRIYRSFDYGPFQPPVPIPPLIIEDKLFEIISIKIVPNTTPYPHGLYSQNKEEIVLLNEAICMTLKTKPATLWNKRNLASISPPPDNTDTLR